MGFRLRFSSSCPSDADSDFHAHSYANSDFHAEPHAYTDGYTNPYSDLYSHADRNADCNLYVVLHSVTDCDDYANIRDRRIIRVLGRICISILIDVACIVLIDRRIWIGGNDWRGRDGNHTLQNNRI